MDKSKTCCFFGHREVTHNIKDKLIAIIERLITEFYVDNQGQFDSMVYSVLKEMKEKYPHIRYTVVLAYIPNEHIKEVYGEDTLFADGLENVPKKFAISKRNDWMIQQFSFAVCYVHKITGGAAKFREKASKKELRVLDPVYYGMIAYGRRPIEKVAGTRDKYHRVKTDKYGLYKGMHEAIISEDLWKKAQKQRKKNQEKYHQKSLNGQTKIHLLSGLLKCPCCGLGMYSNKSIKKKDGKVINSYP